MYWPTVFVSVPAAVRTAAVCYRGRKGQVTFRADAQGIRYPRVRRRNSERRTRRRLHGTVHGPQRSQTNARSLPYEVSTISAFPSLLGSQSDPEHFGAGAAMPQTLRHQIVGPKYPCVYSSSRKVWVSSTIRQSQKGTGEWVHALCWL